MSTNFPTSLDSYAALVDNTDNIVAAHPNDRGDAIEALEAKVGVDSSAVSASHDYKFTHLPAQVQNWDMGSYEFRCQTLNVDVATGTAPLTITSTTAVDNLSVYIDHLTISSEAQGDVIYNDGSNWARLGAGTDGQFLKTQGAGANPAWANILGAWSTSYVEATNYQASTDGIVQAFSTSTARLDIYTDGSNPPTTKRMVNGGGTGGQWGAVSFVRSGDYWRVDRSGGSAATVYWLPIG